LKAISLIDLTTLSGDDTVGRVKRLCAKARQPVRAEMLEALGLPGLPEDAVAALFPWLRDLPPRVLAELRARALYAPYVERQAAELRILEREERLPIPAGLDFAAIPGLSNEMRHRLSKAQPATLGGAGRIPGITPAALAALAVHLRRQEARFT